MDPQDELLGLIHHQLKVAQRTMAAQEELLGWIHHRLKATQRTCAIIAWLLLALAIAALVAIDHFW